MRWILLLASLTCAGLFFTIDSPGLLALDMLGIFVFGIGAVFAFAAARIDDQSRSGDLISVSELAEIRRRAAAGPAPQAPRNAPAAPVRLTDEPDGASIEGAIDGLRRRAAARRDGATPEA